MHALNAVRIQPKHGPLIPPILLVLFLWIANGALGTPHSYQGSVLFNGGLKLDGPFDSSNIITEWINVSVLATDGLRYADLAVGAPLLFGSEPWNFTEDLTGPGFYWSSGDHSVHAGRYDSYYRDSNVITITAFSGFTIRTELTIFNQPLNGIYPFFGVSSVPESASMALLLAIPVVIWFGVTRKKHQRTES